MKTPWMDIAMKERGIRETPGRMDNARVVEYLRTTTYDLPAHYIDEIPWCSAFVNWCLDQAGVKGTNSAWSQSWLDWGKSVDEQFGAIVVFTWNDVHGHTGFVKGIEDDGIYVLGGNQHDSVSISFFSRNNVTDYRLPKRV